MAIARTTTTQQQACSQQNQAYMFKESRWKREIKGNSWWKLFVPSPPESTLFPKLEVQGSLDLFDDCWWKLRLERCRRVRTDFKCWSKRLSEKRWCKQSVPSKCNNVQLITGFSHNTARKPLLYAQDKIGFFCALTHCRKNAYIHIYIYTHWILIWISLEYQYYIVMWCLVLTVESNNKAVSGKEKKQRLVDRRCLRMAVPETYNSRIFKQQ